MKFCYVDEIGNAAASEWFWLGGIVFDEEIVAQFPSIVYEPFDSITAYLLRQHTLKLLRVRNDFLTNEERREFSDDLYAHLERNTEYTIFTVGMHQNQLDDLDDPARIYRFAFTMLVERFDWFLDNLDSDSNGLVYVDTMTHAGEIQEEHSRIRRTGSPYKEINDIISIGAPIDDEYSVGIQLADLVLAGVEGYFNGGFRHFYSEYLFDHMYSRYDGQISGYGVKIHPNSSYEALEFHPDDPP